MADESGRTVRPGLTNSIMEHAVIQFAKPIDTFDLKLDMTLEVQREHAPRRFNLFGTSYRRLAGRDITVYMFVDPAGLTYQGTDWGDGRIEGIRRVDFNCNPNFL